MQQDHDPLPRITLRDENRVPQLGFGTLAVQPDRDFDLELGREHMRLVHALDRGPTSRRSGS